MKNVVVQEEQCGPCAYELLDKKRAYLSVLRNYTRISSASDMAGLKSRRASTTQTPIEALWTAYNENTPDRLKFIDAFLVFIMLSGIFQFLYCILVTNYPFNAFLAVRYISELQIHALRFSHHSFSSSVGQFVLTASLRSQVSPLNRSQFKDVSPERYWSTHTQPVFLTDHLSQCIRRFRFGVHSPSFLCLQLPWLALAKRRFDDATS